MDQTIASPVSPSARRLLPKVSAIGVTQIIGWGTTFNLPGVLGKSIAESLDLSLTVVLAGSTAMLVTLAVVAWALTSYFERLGARPIMLTGTIVAAFGLGLLSLAQNQTMYFLAWIVLGIAGAGILTTSAQIAIAEFAGEGAKQAIGMLALFGGVSSTIFWPTSEALDEQFGWRVTAAIFAGLFLVICLPLVNWAVPRLQPVARANSVSNDPGQARSHLDRTDFALMAGAMAANGFITWGFSLTLIELFESKGLDRTDAIAIASFLGIVGLAARAINYVGGARWSGLTTGLIASTILPASYLLLLGGSGRTIVIAFVLLYGLSSGAMTVARSTIPLAIFPSGSYARASSRLALPLNLSYAAAPPTFGAILTRSGAGTALILATVLSLMALVALTLLAMRTRDKIV